MTDRSGVVVACQRPGEVLAGVCVANFHHESTLHTGHGYAVVGADTEGEFYVELGRRVREARLRRGLTQQQLARSIGLTRTSVANLEAGRQHIQVHSLVDTLVALEVSFEELVPVPNAQHPIVEGQLPPGVGFDTPKAHTELLNRVLASSRNGS